MSEKKKVEINLREYFKDNIALKIEDYWKKYDEVIISSTHCRIILFEDHPVIKSAVKSRTEYQKVGYNNPTDSEREKAAYSISELPSDDLTDAPHSFNLLIRWIGLKNDAIRIAKCFLWNNNNNFLNYFLRKEVEKEIIDKYQYNYIFLASERYNILWAMLYLHKDIFEYFLPKHPDYCFDSLREVFEEIVRSDFDGQLNQCLQERYIHKPHDLKRMHMLQNKISNRSEEEAKELNKLFKTNKIPPNKWGTLVSSLAVELQEIKSIKTLFLQKIKVEQYLHRLEIEKYCNPKYKKHIVSSHTWEKGEIFYEIKKGWKT